MSRERHHYTDHERQEIFDADHVPGTPYAICRYCGRIVRREEDWEVAHETAVARWPWWLPKSWRDANWQVGVAHRECNRAAGTKPMGFWQSISLRWKIRIIGAVGLFVLTLYILAVVFS